MDPSFRWDDDFQRCHTGAIRANCLAHLVARVTFRDGATQPERRLSLPEPETLAPNYSSGPCHFE